VVNVQINSAPASYEQELIAIASWAYGEPWWTESAIAAYERKTKEAHADLAHVTAWLRFFELSGDAAEFPTYIDLNRILRARRSHEPLHGAFKAEGPLDTQELTHQIMAAKRLNPDDRALVQDNSNTIVQTFRMKARRGAALDGSKWRARRPVSVGSVNTCAVLYRT
jgi:hypothetical protein